MGATLIEGIEFFANDHTAFQWGPTLAGALVSAIVGLAALALLIWTLRKAKLKYFAIYCCLIGIITLLVTLWK